MKNLRYLFEASLAYVAYYGLQKLSFERASAIGGALGRFIGPMLRVNRIATNNLKQAIPRLSDDEVKTIIRDMWDNLGRTIGEFSHIPTLTGIAFEERVTFIGGEHIDKADKEGKGFILFSGHFANWEIMPRSVAEYGFPLALVYRPANNPWIEQLIQASRSNSHDGMFPKGPEAARKILIHLKKGGHVGMLVDQKMNDGIPVPFFGRDAMTASALAEFALKFDLPLLPTSSVRKDKTNFEVTVHPPLETKGRTPLDIMTDVNLFFEDCIRKTPAQWLWVHKRWG